MKFSQVATFVASAGVAEGILASRTSLDINQKVNIDSSPVLAGGGDEGKLCKCQQLHVKNDIQVCGTGIKTTAFLRNRCEKYYEHSRQIGQCNKGAATSTCDALSLAQDSHLQHYQSYIIEQC